MIKIMQKLGRVGSELGFTGAPVLGPGWVWVTEVRPGPRLGWVLGRNLRPKLGYAEV
jgi:hypothetical protein